MLSHHRGDDVFRKNVWNAAKSNIHRKKQIQQLTLMSEKNSGDDEKHLQKLRLSASKHDDEDDAK